MTAHDAAALLPALARQALAGTGPIARAHQILTHAMASSFTTAAAFDLCALLILAFAIRMQMARPQGADRCGKRSTKLALAQRGAARSKMTCSGREVAMAVLVLAGLS